MKKGRIIIVSYLLLFIGFCIVLGTILCWQQSIDNNEIETKLGDTQAVKNIIKDGSAFDAHIDIVDDEYYYVYEGKLILRLNRFIRDGKINIQNNTYRSAFYSLSFLRNYILSNGLEGLDLNLMDAVIRKVINYSQSPFYYDKYLNYDHPVSERLETLLLYNSLKIHNGYEVAPIQLAHIKHLIYLLNQDNFFTYNMNHGLMQIRALVESGLILEDSELLKKGKKYLQDVKSIYYAADGSIMESAFGYQYYIFNQFKEFNQLFSMAGMNFLQPEVEKQAEYLKTITSSKSYLQGNGDSKSIFLSDQLFKNIHKNYEVFRFSNKVAGIKSDNYDFIFHFISMDNKPTVHKLPEDLAVFVYDRLPLFVNTGKYSYDENDSVRIKILRPENQNGPKFVNDVSIVGSDITFAEVKNNIVYFTGLAYSSEDTLYRFVNFDLNENILQIKDSSSSDIYSNYLVNSNLNIEKIDEYSLKIYNKKWSTKFQSSKKIHLSNSVVSKGFRKASKTTKVTIQHNNTVSILLPNDFKVDVKSIINNESKNLRYELQSILSKKYHRTLYIAKIIKSYLFSLIVVTILSFLFYLSKKGRLLKYLMGIQIVVLIFNIVLRGEMIIYILYTLSYLVKVYL